MQLEEYIISLEKDAMARWQNGDPYGWIEISDDNVVYIDPDLPAPIIGLENLKKYYKQFEGKIYQYSEFINPKVFCYGELAVLVYNYHSKVFDDSGILIRQTLWNSTEVYCRIKESWKIVHTHWSYIKGKKPNNN